MKLKQYCRYLVDFQSKWIEACSGLMGLAFFACLAYYFAIVSLRDVKVVELIFALALGILFSGGYVVCLSCVRLNAPGLYAIIGVAQCLCILILNISGGGILQIILSVLWYVFASLVLIATAGGYLPGRILACVVFILPAAARILFFDLWTIHLLGWVKEIMILATLSGNACLAMGLRPSSHSRG